MVLVADMVGDHGGWSLRVVGSQPGVYAGLVHGIATRPTQDPRQARSRRNPAAASTSTSGTPSLRPWGNPPHPQHEVHGMQSAF